MNKKLKNLSPVEYWAEYDKKLSCRSRMIAGLSFGIGGVFINVPTYFSNTNPPLFTIFNINPLIFIFAINIAFISYGLFFKLKLNNMIGSLK